jgi:two-component system nitrate/nitrite response regulator NarL
LVRAGAKVFPSELANVLPGPASGSSGPIKTDELRNVHPIGQEIIILRCVANGESNRLIGKKLGISEADLRIHIKQILKKLRVSNRTQAAPWAVARGLAVPPRASFQLGEITGGNAAEHKPISQLRSV